MSRYAVLLFVALVLAGCGARTAPWVDEPMDGCVASEEVCNDVDDDCDGLADEAPSCDVDLGPPEPCIPSEETCNGVDDDCDGATDEGLPTCAPQLACGFGHTCVRRGDGTVACAGGPDGTLAHRALTSVTDAVHLSAGRDLCAVRATGEIVCRAGPIPGISTAVEVATDEALHHYCARLADGSVVCWGTNDHGQLGDGTFAPRERPVAVVGLHDAADLALSYLQSCARRRSGSVVCWGRTEPGPLGRSTFNRARPTPIAGLTDAVEIGAGGEHVCARRRSGSVVCWGENRTGQLGDGTLAPRPNVPAPVPGLDDAVELAIGGYHSCARRASGEVVCWGENALGQLGDGTNVLRATPTPVVGLGTVVDVAAGFRHTCARRTGGDTYCWGTIPRLVGL